MRSLRRAVVHACSRIPAAARWCALVGVLNALIWGFIVPPFEVPDENAHYAYVAVLAEQGKLPRQLPRYEGYSPREDIMLGLVWLYGIIGQPANPAPTTDFEQREIESVQAQSWSAVGSGNAGSATNNPPLYYAVEAVPYLLSPSSSVLNRLAMMRVLSALFAGLTALFASLFLRELFPGTPRAWLVGGLAVALQPLAAFMSGGLNNDAMLYASSAAIFFALARAFRRGLDARSGTAIGLACAIGLLAKLTTLGLLPGVAFALLALVWRSATRGRAIRGALSAVTVWLVPTVTYLLLSGRPLVPGGGVVGTPAAAQAGMLERSYRGELYHIWELFLPRLWFMPRQFAKQPFWGTWFTGLVGRFGWLDTTFPHFIYVIALPICILLLLAALAGLARRRDALAAQWPQLLAYVLIFVGLCLEIGVESYNAYVVRSPPFEQARYLLPALCIYAAVVALALRAVPRRWAPYLAAVLIMLFFAHNLFSQLQVIARFYA